MYRQLPCPWHATHTPCMTVLLIIFTKRNHKLMQKVALMQRQTTFSYLPPAKFLILVQPLRIPIKFIFNNMPFISLQKRCLPRSTVCQISALSAMWMPYHINMISCTKQASEISPKKRCFLQSSPISLTTTEDGISPCCRKKQNNIPKTALKIGIHCHLLTDIIQRLKSCYILHSMSLWWQNEGHSYY